MRTVKHSMTSSDLPFERYSIERIEQEAWLDLFAAVPPQYAQEAEVCSTRLGPYGLLANKAVPISEFNRALGINHGEPLDDEIVNDVVAWLRRNAASNWAIQVVPDGHMQVIDRCMHRHGIAQSGNGWAKFTKSAVKVDEEVSSTGLNIQRAQTRDAQDFGRVVTCGFGLPKAAAPWFAALVGRSNWNTYLAFDGKTAIAAGALYLGSDWGWLGIDTTLSEYRGRGAQTALIKRRVADGVDAGLRGFTAETGQPSIEDEGTSTSYQNYKRCGFARAYVRANYRAVPS